MTKMQKLRKQYIKLQPLWDAFKEAGRRGWSVQSSECPKGPYQEKDEIKIELETWSPAGENIVEYLYLGEDNDSIIEQLYKLATNYDADEHAEMWCPFRGAKGVPSGIRELIDDADEIGKMYWELYETANKILGDK